MGIFKEKPSHIIKIQYKITIQNLFIEINFVRVSILISLADHYMIKKMQMIIIMIKKMMITSDHFKSVSTFSDIRSSCMDFYGWRHHPLQEFLTVCRRFKWEFFLIKSTTVPYEMSIFRIVFTSPVLSSSGNALHGMLKRIETESRIFRLEANTSYLSWNSASRTMAQRGSIPCTAGPSESKEFRNWITSTTNVYNRGGIQTTHYFNKSNTWNLTSIKIIEWN